MGGAGVIGGEPHTLEIGSDVEQLHIEFPAPGVISAQNATRSKRQTALDMSAHEHPVAKYFVTPNASPGSS